MDNQENQIRLRGSAVTNIGQVRSHNEDNVHLWSGDNLVLAIVADGMGGAAAGEEASRIAVETIATELGISPSAPLTQPDIAESALSSAVLEANRMIMQEAVDHPSNKGMGTTVTMVFINGNEARFAHVGDSRAYLVHQNGTITQITSDHSFVQALVEANHITPEQAETHPMRNVLYRALGQTKELDVDTYVAQLKIGDRLVLCSDGLTGHVRAPEIAKMVAASDNPVTISQQLVALANKRGGEDNISVIVIIVSDESVSNRIASDEANFEDDETLIPTTRGLRLPGDKPDTSNHSPEMLQPASETNYTNPAEGYDSSYPPR
jgi:PPM family protein phosphatase